MKGLNAFYAPEMFLVLLTVFPPVIHPVSRYQIKSNQFNDKRAGTGHQQCHSTTIVSVKAIVQTRRY